MNCLPALTLVLLFFACTGQGRITNDKVLTESCSCDEKQDTDTVFFATNVQLEEKGGKKMIHYNCAAIAVGTASVSGANGLEHCETLYGLQCVSSVKNSLILPDSFTYFAEAMKTMKVSRAGAQALFFEGLKRKQTGYFEFTVVNKELKIISEINMK